MKLELFFCRFHKLFFHLFYLKHKLFLLDDVDIFGKQKGEFGVEFVGFPEMAESIERDQNLRFDFLIVKSVAVEQYELL